MAQHSDIIWYWQAWRYCHQSAYGAKLIMCLVHSYCHMASHVDSNWSDKLSSTLFWSTSKYLPDTLHSLHKCFLPSSIGTIRIIYAMWHVRPRFQTCLDWLQKGKRLTFSRWDTFRLVVYYIRSTIKLNQIHRVCSRDVLPIRIAVLKHQTWWSLSLSISNSVFGPCTFKTAFLFVLSTSHGHILCYSNPSYLSNPYSPRRSIIHLPVNGCIQLQKYQCVKKMNIDLCFSVSRGHYGIDSLELSQCRAFVWQLDQAITI